jgi:dynactin 4
LNCNYCMWTSLEIGIKFDKPTNIRSQLDKIANGGKPKPQSKRTEFSDPLRTSSLAREPFSPSSTDEKAKPSAEDPEPETPLDPIARFAALKSFYKSQLSLSSATDPNSSLPSAGDIAYSSPSSLARIVTLYTTLGTNPSLKKPKSRAPGMREALTPAEGLLLPPALNSSTASTQTTKITHLAETASFAQKSFQQSGSGSGTPHARLVSDLRPMPALLRTKRAKRCAACKHILVKPESKPTSTRYRIKLTALNYIPLVILKPMPGTAVAKLTSGEIEETTLQPHRPHQWVLTLKNHLFDTVKVSLATPAVTPGRLGHRVTVLCPQFEVGANSDVWDDALGDKRMSVAMSGPRGDVGVAEAGKVYDKGRNWTSVVLEVVPVGAVRPESLVNVRQEQSLVESSRLNELEDGIQNEHHEDASAAAADDDDNVIEIPIRVRLEWRQSDAEEGEDGAKKTTTRVNEDGEVVDEARRELAYWMVLGVGRAGS